jgi:hypothetical protein
MALNLLTKLAVATVGVSLSFAAIEAHPAQAAQAAGFGDSYNPSAWTLTNDNADGYVNTNEALGSFVLTGGNKGDGYGAGSTTYGTTILNPGTVSFNWDYSTADWSGGYDPAGWSLNGVFTQLSNNTTKSSSGSVTTLVKAGDIFGFFVNTVDNVLGAANLKVSSFSAPGSCSATND